MFIKVLELMGTSEQQAKWLEPANRGQINGAYVQTELGHGTFVRGIETRAVFDAERDGFVINTPTLSATKFWPGALGYSATHGIIMARLIIGGGGGGDSSCSKGQDYGVHAFMMQLRDIETGRAFPGITLGDIGPKLNHNQNDNGYARFDGVFVPRANMLAAQAFVSRDGTFAKAPGVHDKAAYGTMMVTRSKMTWSTGLQLAAAITVAVRWSTVREQGNFAFADDGEKKYGKPQEVALINFRSQHYRLLTSLSKAYAMLFSSRHCEAVRGKFEERKQKYGDYSTMGAAHALIGGVKAWCAHEATEGAEDARRTCGGQGYLSTSGMPDIVQTLAITCTGEGDTHVLYQQTARFLMKWALGWTLRPEVDVTKTNIPEDLRYLAELPRTSASLGDLSNLDTQLAIFRTRAQRVVARAASKVAQEIRAGVDKPKAWNKHIMILMAAAKAHVEYIILREFVGAVTKVTSSSEDRAICVVMYRLCALFALTTMTGESGGGGGGGGSGPSFLEDAALVPARLGEARELISRLLDELLPDAIGLTDAWDFTDGCLCSAIGRYDGDAYATLMRWTEQLPINVTARANDGVHTESWTRFIRPTLKSKL